MRRALTVLTLPILLLSAWDCVPKARESLQLWSRLRQRHHDPPDVSWDTFYSQLTPLLPPRVRVGLVQAAAPDTPAWARQYYYMQSPRAWWSLVRLGNSSLPTVRRRRGRRCSTPRCSPW